MFKPIVLGVVLVVLVGGLVGASYWYGKHSNNPTTISFSPIAFATPSQTPDSSVSPTPFVSGAPSPVSSPMPTGFSCPERAPQGYMLMRGWWSGQEVRTPDEFLVDLKGDGAKELVRVYEESSIIGTRSKPVIVKVFSDSSSACQEVFSYTGKQTADAFGASWGSNEIGFPRPFDKFFGDAKQAFLFEPITTGYGSGYSAYVAILTWQAGSFQVLEGPQLNELTAYDFRGTDFPAQTILVARSIWGPDPLECHFCDHLVQFERYEWADGQYAKTTLGTTKNKYNLVAGGSESARANINAIIKAEPQALTP